MEERRKEGIDAKIRDTAFEEEARDLPDVAVATAAETVMILGGRVIGLSLSITNEYFAQMVKDRPQTSSEAE